MRSITTWTFKPDEPLELANRFSTVEGSVLLHSGGELDSAQASYLCLFPDEKITVAARPGCWERLEQALGPFDSDLPIPKWVGYLGYEMGCYADEAVVTPYFCAETPDACFYRPTVVIHFNHLTREATLYAEKALSLNGEAVSLPTSKLKLVEATDTLESYLTKIARIKEWILEGEVYQLNLSQAWRLEGRSDPFSLFKKVSTLNPAPFSAYFKGADFALVSSSPERFLSKRGKRLESRPIKGTAPRGKNAAEDAVNKEALLESEKERAELLMITDLMRNDLGKVSKPGTVKTEDIWRCERYTNVFHLLSIITGESSLEPVTLLRSLFPGGSITGCPKLRAMEGIAALEERPRGVYTGSIGYFAANGDFDFNIAIRTLLVYPQSIQIQLGGAIVIDSDPMREYEETLQKGESLFHIVGADELCLL